MNPAKNPSDCSSTRPSVSQAAGFVPSLSAPTNMTMSAPINMAVDLSGLQRGPESSTMPKPFSSRPAVPPSNVTAPPVVTRKNTVPTGGSSSSSGSRMQKKRRTVGSLGIDDDINDVATMGGVDVTRESQESTSSDVAEEAEARSCKDENFLFTAPLQRKIAAIAAYHGISVVQDDVVALVSSATQERLKTLAEKLIVVAEHRQEDLRNKAHCEVSQDVRQQLRFLEDLGKLEKKRRDEEEREMNTRSPPSRSLGDDAEQLQQGARDLQRAEMEEVRQHGANVAELAALPGPREKPETGTVDTPIVLSPEPEHVAARDLLFLLEQEKTTSTGSDFIYKAYMKF